MVIFALLIPVVPLYLLYKVRIVQSSGKIRNRTAVFVIGFILLNVAFGTKNSLFITRTQHHPLFGFFISLKSYLKESGKLEKAYSEKVSKNIYVVQDVEKSSAPDMLVVAIGESLTRKHMQLYGYKRATNPKLTEIKDNLIVFNKAYTEYFSTIPSLTAVLTYRENNVYLPVINILNKVNYNTYWISNQAALGAWDTMLTMVVQGAKYRQFVNINTGVKQTQLLSYDEKLLPQLRKVVTKNTLNNIVFLHMMGSHLQYSARYPKSFDYFKTKDGIASKPWLKKEKQYDKINEYDNSVRYNDAIIADIINELGNTDKTVVFIYFSDHGESVFDDGNFAGHADSVRSKYTSQVPFIIWANNRYKAKYPDQIKKFNNLAGTDYNIAEFKDMVLDMLAVSYTAPQQE
ncbi:MAG: phosphoethanolamine transferase [Deferribacterales bacterium]